VNDLNLREEPVSRIAPAAVIVVARRPEDQEQQDEDNQMGKSDGPTTP